MKIEYRVREVTRYIVTRFEEGDEGKSSSVRTCGEYDNFDMAYNVGYALAQADKERFNVPSGDTRVMFPEPRADAAAAA